ALAHEFEGAVSMRRRKPPPLTFRPVSSRAAPRVDTAGEEAALGLAHHGTTPSSLEKLPVGPSDPSSAMRTAALAPASTLPVPRKLLRSVAINPGHTALTLIELA